jgi:hypothetical protein
LLSAINVVSCAYQGGIGHDVYGESGHICRLNKPPDCELGSKLVTAGFQVHRQGVMRAKVYQRTRRYKVTRTGASFPSIVHYNAYFIKGAIAEQSDEGIAQYLRINCAGAMEKSGILRNERNCCRDGTYDQYYRPIAPLILFWLNGDGLMSAAALCRPCPRHVGFRCTA